ncbi:MAG: hypothetical protein IJQ31_08980, partial [Thermoguttaceae bacterium]|nr:hypothetical protein [Thermoguttaceae bacterium]
PRSAAAGIPDSREKAFFRTASAICSFVTLYVSFMIVSPWSSLQIKVEMMWWCQRKTSRNDDEPPKGYSESD